MATRTITCGGARCRWDQDAHFALPRVRAAWAQLAEWRRRGVSGNVPENLNAIGEDRHFPETRGTSCPGDQVLLLGSGLVRAAARTRAGASPTLSGARGRLCSLRRLRPEFPESFRKS